MRRFGRTLVLAPIDQRIPKGVVLVGHITGMREEPVANALALRHATAYLRQTRVQEAVNRRFSGVVAAGMKDVKFAKGYEPPKAPPAAAAKAPAPAKSN